jgi:hypothetical protein
VLRALGIQGRNPSLGCCCYRGPSGQNNIARRSLPDVHSAIVAIVRMDRGAFERDSQPRIKRSTDSSPTFPCDFPRPICIFLPRTSVKMQPGCQYDERAAVSGKDLKTGVFNGIRRRSGARAEITSVQCVGWLSTLGQPVCASATTEGRTKVGGTCMRYSKFPLGTEGTHSRKLWELGI